MLSLPTLVKLIYPLIERGGRDGCITPKFLLAIFMKIFAKHNLTDTDLTLGPGNKELFDGFIEGAAGGVAVAVPILSVRLT